MLCLGLSGILGIAIGDTLFFKTLSLIGPRLTMLLGNLEPVFVVLLAILFLGERPPAVIWPGILLVLGGLHLITLNKATEEQTNGYKKIMPGLSTALLSLLCAAGGIILAKTGLQKTTALQGTFLRLSYAALSILCWGTASRRLGAWLQPLKKEGKHWKRLTITFFVVIFGGFLMFMLSLKYVDAYIAGILNSTAPLFTLLFSYILLKEKISRAEIAGALLSFSGIIVILAYYKT